MQLEVPERPSRDEAARVRGDRHGAVVDRPGGRSAARFGPLREIRSVEEHDRTLGRGRGPSELKRPDGGRVLGLEVCGLPGWKLSGDEIVQVPLHDLAEVGLVADAVPVRDQDAPTGAGGLYERSAPSITSRLINSRESGCLSFSMNRVYDDSARIAAVCLP